jgi:hypothetical protein
MSRFEKWNVWIASVLVTATGLGLLWTKYLMRAQDPWSVINHPLQPWFLKAHIITAPLLVFAIGLIATRHIWPHFRAGIRRGRTSGILAAFFALPMILTGYLIQVVTHAAWLRALAMSHIALGLVFAVGLTVHQVVARARRSVRRSRRRSSTPERHGPGDRSVERSRPADREIFARGG